MTPTEAYAEELAALRGLLSQPAPGIHLLEFATIPQLEGILSDLRPVCAERGCIELEYDPAKDSPGSLIDRSRQEILKSLQHATPLLILRPHALPDASKDGPAIAAYWKAMNFRREALGALPAQILLCVDPWSYAHLVDEALDLLSWVMPKFHLLPPPDSSPARTEMLSGSLALAQIPVSPAAANARWETFWPVVEEQLRSGPLPSSAIRRHILPLLESALAVGNLVHARRVLSAVGGTRIPQEDLVKWHELNAILSCGAGDAALAEDHALRLLALVEESGDDQLRDIAAYALCNVSNLLSATGRFSFAESLCRHLLAYSVRKVGEEHSDTLSYRNNLAIALRSQGKYEEAEEEHRAVLAIRERVLGPDHPDTLSSRINLANTLSSKGNLIEAENEFRAMLALHERVHGPEHPDSLSIRMNLAIALDDQGKHEEAERNLRVVYAIRTRVLGPEHPDTLMSQFNLANVLDSLGKDAEAEREYRAVLALLEQTLGPEHPDVFSACFNLSLALAKQGRKTEALQLARRALEGGRRILGAHHPDTQAAERIVDRLEHE